MGGEATRWQRIAVLFSGALERPAAERAAFLSAGCDGDAALMREVEALVASHDEAELVMGESVSGYLGPVLAGAGPASDPAGEVEPGRDIGAYRLVRELGRGGMGAVYLAERADAQFRKQVALKLVKRGTDTDEVLHRFRAERQILASLEHPNIARLLDGGVADDGLPYIVMEYVPGRPIDRDADERRLTVDERLRLFRVVCEAVQYAHQNLVVHRDLKPSNILVADDGTVKLLDFGIAKLLEEESEAPRTRTGLRRLTPEHAAPEQIRGGAITTATDVYALGVLLYQLLTGRRPLEVAGRDLRELEDAVLGREPLRPGAAVARAEGAVLAARRTTADRLARRLRGDLDLIVLKALDKDPARRYQSAQQLLDDIDRHLSGLPVRARRATPGYRLRKFARRHQAEMAAALGLLVVLAGFTGFHTLRITSERDRARQEAEKARASTEFLQRLLGDAYPSTALGDTFSMSDLLVRAEARIDSLEGQPDLQAELLRTLGDVYREQGRFDAALPLIQRAVALQRDGARPASVELGKTLSALGHLYHQMGDLEAASRAHREELAVLSPLLPGHDSLVLTAINNLAAAASKAGRYAEALGLHREVLARGQGVLGDNSELMHSTHHNMGYIYGELGDLAQAERYYQRALATRRSVLGPAHPRTALTLSNLAALYRDAGRLDEAEALLRESLAGAERSLGSDHHQVGLAASHLGSVLRRRERFAEAESLHRVSVAIYRRAYGERHLKVAYELQYLGGVLRDAGDCGAALPVLGEAQVLLDENEIPPDHRRQVLNRTVLGDCLAAQGRFAEAEPLLVERYREARTGDSAAPVRGALERLVGLYHAWGRRDDAAAYRALLSEVTAETPPAALRPR